MHIEHAAIWTRHLERLKGFYEHYFQAEAGLKYRNLAKEFESCFLTFPADGARLELMSRPGLEEPDEPGRLWVGYAHLSFSTGSKERVDALTDQLCRDGFSVIDGPRYTGDGYYESKVLDPDGNVVEITI